MRGIYAITNVLTGRVYYGQAQDLENRKSAHRSMLNRGNHHNPHLQASWKKYGGASFLFNTVYLAAEGDNLTILEKQYVAGAEKTYNIKDPEDPKVWTPEAKKKVSDFHKGNKWGLGYKPSEAIRKKTSERSKGKKYALGAKRSKEFKLNLAARMKGNTLGVGLHRKHVSESKAKMSAAARLRIGEKRSPEARENIRQGQLKRWEVFRDLKDLS